MIDPDSLTPFVDPLPIPEVLRSTGDRADPDDAHLRIPCYRVTMRQTTRRLHRDLPPTRLWTYGSSLPGPTIETRSGRGVLVEWVNALPTRHLFPIDHKLHGAEADKPAVRAVVHVHGAKAPPHSDGYPEDWYVSGKSALYHYPNRQDAATLWYHDHAMGIDRLNMYAGLIGVFIVRDDVEDRLGLPAGACDIPLVLCDRLLTPQGQLAYPVSPNPESPWIPDLFGDDHPGERAGASPSRRPAATIPFPGAERVQCAALPSLPVERPRLPADRHRPGAAPRAGSPDGPRPRSSRTRRPGARLLPQRGRADRAAERSRERDAVPRGPRQGRRPEQRAGVAAHRSSDWTSRPPCRRGPSRSTSTPTVAARRC